MSSTREHRERVNRFDGNGPVNRRGRSLDIAKITRLPRAPLSAAWLFATLILPGVMSAEQRIVIEPSVNLIQILDDNLNVSVHEPLRDHILRITPALELRAASPRWSATGTYAIDIERYATHAQLDSPRAREHAAARIGYAAAPRLALSMDGEYLTTNNLTEIYAATGLVASRVRGRRYHVRPAARFRVSPNTSVGIEATLLNTDVEQGPSMRENAQAVFVQRQLTPRDLVRFDYGHNGITFGRSVESTDLHSARMAWSHDFGSSALMLQGGPRLANGVPGLDLSASLSHDRKSTSTIIAVQQSETAVVGYAGLVETRSMQVRFSFRPRRDQFVLHATPALIYNAHRGHEATVYQMGLGARYAVTPLLAVDVHYAHATQKGAIDPMWAGTELAHSTLSVGFSTRWRSDERYGPGRLR